MPKPITLNPRSRLHRTAVHEAGHAVLALAGGNGLDHITVIPGSGYLGMVRGRAHVDSDESSWGPADRRRARYTLAELLAGTMAAAKFVQQEWSWDFARENGGGDDLDQWQILATIGPYRAPYKFDPDLGQQVQELGGALRHSTRLASKTLDANWSIVLNLAERVLVQHNVRGDQARAIYERLKGGQ